MFFGVFFVCFFFSRRNPLISCLRRTCLVSGLLRAGASGFLFLCALSLIPPAFSTMPTPAPCCSIVPTSHNWSKPPSLSVGEGAAGPLSGWGEGSGESIHSVYPLYQSPCFHVSASASLPVVLGASKAWATLGFCVRQTTLLSLWLSQTSSALRQIPLFSRICWNLKLKISFPFILPSCTYILNFFTVGLVGLLWKST